MRPFPLSEAARAMGGEVLGAQPDALVAGVSRDTRDMAGGDLYFALVGERFDGHEFAPAALEHGAVAVVMQKPVDVAGPVIRVPDTEQALGRLANWYLGQLRCQVAAVTGSVGKTTTREMMTLICAAAGPTVAARENYNNEVGVPLTVLEADDSTRFLVLELAMRGPGEIKYLADIAPPNVAAITNIQITHAGRLGGRDGIAAAKAEILDGLATGGRGVVPAEDDYAEFLLERAGPGAVTFGLEAGDVRCEWLDEDLEAGTTSVRLHLPGDGAEAELACVGRHFAHDAACAAAVAHALGLSAELTTGALASYAPHEGRGKLLIAPSGARIVDDTYNAAPSSVIAALEVLARRPGRRIAVLGDMLELGPYEAEAHRSVGRRAAELGLDQLICVGDLARMIGDGALEVGLSPERLCLVEDREGAAARLAGRIGPGDTVLVKGSRGARTELIVGELMGESC